MSILIITPARRGTRHGNRVTAVRWARLLRSLGHRVVIATRYERQPCDLLIALHARRSAPSIRAFRARQPAAPLIVALTGTDLYHDLATSAAARASLDLADWIVALQPLAAAALPPRLRPKVVPIVQSATTTSAAPRHAARTFDVCVVGHLRPVKDPFRTAMAARLLPTASRVRIIHVGAAMTPAMDRQARAEQARNARYAWLGELPAWRTRRVMKNSRLLVVSSRLEGGANVVSEALADGVPVIGSDIPGNVGLLGRLYPGYYPVGDTRALARLLRRVESDPAYYAALCAHCAALAPMVLPAAERAGWARLLARAQRTARDASRIAR